MKKKLIIGLMITTALALTSCATTKAQPAPQQVKEVVKDDSVPSWFYNTPIAEDVHYATGTAKAVNRQTAIKIAEMAARNQMAEWIETNVKEVMTNYVNDAGEGDNRQNLDAFESISVQVATASLKGVTREKFEFDDDGNVYVLMSIPLASVESAFEPASAAVAEKFSQNDAAAEANAKMQSAFEELLNGNL
ncbi:MAG: hypothetical protein M0P10_11430 [Sphaerochaetaceae bacterium]|jgi:hypothetical protein|nr:hypothetical protein [Sphaerochaetaceae bacterium]